MRDLGDGWALLHIDRHLLHDLSGPPALAEIAKRGLARSQSRTVFAVPDHAVSSAPGRARHDLRAWRAACMARSKYAQRKPASGSSISDKTGQGIVHVIGPELGLVLPGVTLICGDSHTCTNGALGATGLWRRLIPRARTRSPLKPCVNKSRGYARALSRANLRTGVTPKDLILHLIGKIGAAAASGHAIEYAGSAIRADADRGAAYDLQSLGGAWRAITG